MSDAPSISIGTITGGQNNIGKTEIAGDQVQNNHYGATSPAEFFAVITEMFFEKPRALKRRHPELYAELAGFYRQDPAAR